MRRFGFGWLKYTVGLQADFAPDATDFFVRIANFSFLNVNVNEIFVRRSIDLAIKVKHYF